MGYCIRGGNIVTPTEVIKTNLIMEGNHIVHIGDDLDHECEIIDAEGMYVLPGLIDIHCDAIEKEVQPRPNTLFPIDMALYDYEKKLVGQGITTMLHSLSLGVGLSIRGVHLFTEMVNKISEYRKQSTMIRNLLHMRYEITYFDGLDIFEDYVARRVVDYISLMNHYPGQGQYRVPGSFEKYVMKNQGVDQFEVQTIVESVMAKQNGIDWDRLRRITKLAKQQGIAVASHDDDSPDKVDESIQMGINVVEFPITAETAAYATKRNLHVCVGAPNVVRGGSHENNLNAMEALKQGHANIVCSDYHPSSLLASLFLLHQSGVNLAESVNMASLNPARALGLERQIGSIEVGKKADIILVSEHHRHPIVRKTWVHGNLVYSCGYFEMTDMCSMNHRVQ